jgi:hypothetical protein
MRRQPHPPQIASHRGTTDPVSGAIAQLGERLHGMQEVGGSIPPGSTKFRPNMTAVPDR